MSSAAASLVRVMKSRPDQPAPPIEGDFEQAIARKMEARGITTVPGLPADEPEPQWYDRAIELHRRHSEREEARRQAEEDAAKASQSVTSLLAGEILKQAIAVGTGNIPLNGAAVLRAALAGSPGTINGDQP